MKKPLFIFSLCCIFLYSCTTVQSDSYNAKTLEEGQSVLIKNMSSLEMRNIRGGIWKSLLPIERIKKENLEACLNTYEYFYNNLENTTIELSTEEQYFFEDLENNGLSIGAISPFNAVNRLKSSKFFIPDPWTKTNPSGNWIVKALYQAVHQSVNDNAKSKLNLKSMLVLLADPIFVYALFLFLSLNN